MTAPLKLPHRERKLWIDDVKQELARVMEREAELRTAEREDRMRQLGLNVNMIGRPDRSQREH